MTKPTPPQTPCKPAAKSSVDDAMLIALPVSFVWLAVMLFNSGIAQTVHAYMPSSPLIAVFYNMLSMQALTGLVAAVNLGIAAVFTISLWAFQRVMRK